MRGLRWLLLVALAAILGGIVYQYRAQKQRIGKEAVPPPPPLSADLKASSPHWQLRDKDLKTGRIRSDLDAESMEQVKDSSRVDLKNVSMKIYAKDGKTFDLVKSAAASFNTEQRSLFSQGEVEITLSLPAEGQPEQPPTVIKTSGLTCDSASGRVDTDQAASFVFAKGDGKSTGATYDPATRELLMKHDVEVHWIPPDANGHPMKVEGASLSWHELTKEIWLKPWGRLTRDAAVLEGNDVVVKLDDKKIHNVTAVHAHGADEYPNRKLRYAAEELAVDFDEAGVARHVTANRNASLVSITESAETTVIANRVELEFLTDGGESVLTNANTFGGSQVTSKPLAIAGRPLPETHILRAENMEVKMRPGGREIASVVTHVPSTLEFLPNTPLQRHRVLDGRDFNIQYAPQNRLDHFHAINAKTRTEPNADEKKRNRQPNSTASREIDARFDPKTGHLAALRQTGDFTYEEGDRRARAATANMDADQNVILLDTGARVWDATGSTAGDHIRLDQKSGDFSAEGNVATSRLPDKDQKKNSEMLSGDDPIQGTARKMDSRSRNTKIHYEGNVRLWQGANRIQADVVDIDRSPEVAKRSLIADGHVFTTLWDAPKNDKAKPAANPVLTEVRAPHLVYTESDRVAHYTGGSEMKRPGLQVKSRDLRAYLSDGSADSRLDKAVADTGVEILSTAKDRTRTGTGEHAEYYAGDQKVIVRGPRVRLVEKLFANPQPTTTEGKEATYWANDDRLLMTGEAAKPGNSTVNRKKGK